MSKYKWIHLQVTGTLPLPGEEICNRHLHACAYLVIYVLHHIRGASATVSKCSLIHFYGLPTSMQVRGCIIFRNVTKSIKKHQGWKHAESLCNARPPKGPRKPSRGGGDSRGSIKLPRPVSMHASTKPNQCMCQHTANGRSCNSCDSYHHLPTMEGTLLMAVLN